MKSLHDLNYALLARHLGGVTGEAVRKWFLDIPGNSMPADRVIPVCRAVNWTVTPHELRSDIYPNPSDGMPKKRQK